MGIQSYSSTQVGGEGGASGDRRFYEKGERWLNISFSEVCLNPQRSREKKKKKRIVLRGFKGIGRVMSKNWVEWKAF